MKRLLNVFRRRSRKAKGDSYGIVDRVRTSTPQIATWEVGYDPSTPTSRQQPFQGRYGGGRYVLPGRGPTPHREPIITGKPINYCWDGHRWYAC